LKLTEFNDKAKLGAPCDCHFFSTLASAVKLGRFKNSSHRIYYKSKKYLSINLQIMATLEDKSIWEDGEDSLGEEVLRMSTDEIASRARLLDNGKFNPAFSTITL
jgi:hypothetical protein